MACLQPAGGSATLLPLLILPSTHTHQSPLSPTRVRAGGDTRAVRSGLGHKGTKGASREGQEGTKGRGRVSKAGGEVGAGRKEKEEEERNEGMEGRGKGGRRDVSKTEPQENQRNKDIDIGLWALAPMNSRIWGLMVYVPSPGWTWYQRTQQKTTLSTNLPNSFKHHALGMSHR